MARFYSRVLALLLLVSVTAFSHARKKITVNPVNHRLKVVTAVSNALSKNTPVLIDDANRLLPKHKGTTRSYTMLSQDTDVNASNIIQRACCFNKNDRRQLDRIASQVFRVRNLVREVKTHLACETAIPIFAKDINPNGFKISKGGVYCLAEDVRFKPSAPNLSAIVIDIGAGKNVVLDLNGKTLSQNGTNAGVNGILINASDSVSIKNGTITDFTLFGVRINPPSGFSNLSNLSIFRCGAEQTIGGGIGASSTLDPQTKISLLTHDLSVDQVNASNNIFAGLTLAGVVNATVIQSIFNNNIATLVQLFAGADSWGVLATPIITGLPCKNISFTDCQANGNNGQGISIGMETVSVPVFGLPSNENINFIRCIANNNVGGGRADLPQEGEGFVIAGTRSWVLRDCIAQGNHTSAQAPSGTPGVFASAGYSIPFGAVGGLIENCVAENNSGNGDISTGFRIFRSSQITISNCTASNHTTNAKFGEVWGFTTDTNIGNLSGTFGMPQNENFVFDSCKAEQNLNLANASVKLSGGFKFISQISSTLTNCSSIGNTVGIFVGDPSCCNTGTCQNLDKTCGQGSNCCPTKNNVISRNTIVGNKKAGIVDRVARAKTAYFANVARSNGMPGKNYVGKIFPSPVTCQNPNTCVSANLTPIRLWILPNAPCAINTNCVSGDELDNLDIRS